jgi:glycosyltransferase involved in cell wall biosynthesis
MKVLYYPYQPHCFAFGGFDMQMINTLDSVIKQGVDASRMDVWSRNKDFDILHLWGVDENNYQLIDWCKKSGKLVVATVLLPYYDTFRSQVGQLYRTFFPGKFKRQQKYLNLLNRIIVLNDVQAEVLRKYYQVPTSKIEIIPNIVEQQFFENTAVGFSKKYQVFDYVLCTGNICTRKNQYNLALACIQLNYNLVLIGNVLDGEQLYAEKLKELISNYSNITWIKELPKASDDLVAAYKDCSLFALPSLSETQPISALEAASMQKPIILLNKGYAHQSYYDGAILSNSSSVKNIKVALNKGMKLANKTFTYPQIEDCKEENVGLLYLNCYNNIC